MPTFRHVPASEAAQWEEPPEEDDPEEPVLSPSEIREWTGDRSFELGRRYFQRGAISSPARQGDTLKAFCQGSAAQPYRVEALLGIDGILAAHCSCPVGGYGRCKHVAALLIAWEDDPEAFVAVRSIEEALESRSKAELVALIRKMVGRYPDLELLLELPRPGAEASERLDPGVIRRQVAAAVDMAGDEWGAAATAAARIRDVVEIGDSYADVREWHNAATVYTTVAREVLSYFDVLHDEEGNLTGIVNDCLERLEPCLAATTDPEEREMILRALFDVNTWDIRHGGYGAGDEGYDLLLSMTTPEERRRVAEWVRAAMADAKGQGWSDDWQRQAYGKFLLDLQGEELDDESFLRICRESGRLTDLVARLLDLRRVEKAREAARGAGDYVLLGLADLFRAGGHPGIAEQLIVERAATSSDKRLREWLKERAKERGDVAEALALMEALFWQRPSLTGYQELKSLAQQLGGWDASRPSLLARLADEKNYALLTEIHLEEGEIDRALEAVKHVPLGWWGVAGSLAIRVARAAEADRPEAAIRIYLDATARLIEARGRENYAQAAQYLLRVRDLFRRLGADETWRDLIARIREENRRLPALKEELNRAGLE